MVFFQVFITVLLGIFLFSPYVFEITNFWFTLFVNAVRRITHTDKSKPVDEAKFTLYDSDKKSITNTGLGVHIVVFLFFTYVLWGGQ